jgi:hypothetical protein
MGKREVIGLRNRAVELQDEEERLLLEARSLSRSGPSGFQVAVRAWERELRRSMQTAVNYHHKISDLLEGRGLENISDLRRLRQIVAIQQKLVQLVSDSLKKVRAVLAQRVTDN